jgi:hypothetical protein
MNYFTERENQISLLEKSFSDELAHFPAYLREELTSLLAFAISEATNSCHNRCFAKAISHITSKKGFMSYRSLSKEERLCVDIFAQQEISKQEHIVFYHKNYLDTLRICDALANSIETRAIPLATKHEKGFIAGFVSTATRIGKLVIQMVSAKTGGKYDK